MLRRFFLTALPSSVALTISGLQPVAAAEQPAAPPNTPSFPEPAPIVVDPATTERAQRLLDAVARGTFDRSQLSPQLDAFLPTTIFASGVPFVSALGSPQSMFAFEKRITADQTSTYFRVRFSKEVLTWVVSVDADNGITGLSLRRSPNNRIFSVVYRDIQY